MNAIPCSLAKGEIKLPEADKPNPNRRASTATVRGLLLMRTEKKDWADSWETDLKDSGTP